MNKVIHKKSTSTINAKGVMKRHFKSALALFMPLFVVSCLTISSALILSSSGSTAIETEAITTTVKVLEACSMTANPDSTDTAHSVEMIGGTVENSIGVTTIDVTCNDRDGYSVYAVGYGNNTVGNTDLTGAVTGQTIPTGTNMTTSVSNWAMRLTAVDNSTNYFVPTILSDANGSFAANHAVPSNNIKVVTFQNAIDVSKPSRFTTTYAAAITPYQAADTYTGQVKYTLVHPNYTNADGTTESYPVTLTLNNAESIIIDGTTYTASSATPSLTYGTHSISGTYPSGYEFDSWSSTGSISIASTSTASTTMTVSGAGTLTLNAKQSCVSSLSGNMQDWTTPASSVCDGATGTMKDNRNGQKTYTVAKLADGKIWMTTNLDLPGGTVLNASNSDVPSDGYFTVPTSNKTGFSDDSTAYAFNSNSTDCSSAAGGCYSYYSWLTATAGGKDASGTAVTGSGYNASYSICPKGWRLPTSTTSNAQAATDNNWKTGDFYALATAYGANLESSWFDTSNATGANFYTNAGSGTTPGFLLAGYYGHSEFYDGGSYGRYWSSTSFSGTRAYRLYFNSSSVYSAYDTNRRYGLSVRCVFGE